MKTRFNTYDIVCMVTELQRLIGMRVNQVYDIDNKTYVIRLQRSEEKSVLLLESGNRFHTTHFEWPKNVAPSGFTMKLRKHLKNKRLEKLSQLGIDRIVDLQFGSGEAAYHVILELYDRGNIVLTDHEWTILNVLRPHVEGDKIRFAVKEKYPLDRAKTSYAAPSKEALQEILAKSKPGDNLKKILNPNVEFGSSIIDHVLLENGLSGTMKLSKEGGKGFNVEEDLDKLVTALKQAEQLLDEAKTTVAKGYITQKIESRPLPDGEESIFRANQEFHPKLFAQHREMPHDVHDTFDRAVDEFFSRLEGQKIDLKTVAIEREALKKLQNVRVDHERRVTELTRAQDEDRRAAELITRNEVLVEQARQAVQAALANQMSWNDIKLFIKTAQDNKDPIASVIKQLKLDTNHITLMLSDPYEEEIEPMAVDIDLSLSAFANARRYYDQKRNAAKKQQKTLESAGKALKNAERKTKQTLKEVHTVSNIIKARKTYWFEKFFWFISSDNYLVIGGRDQQQNELLVKRYMRATDIYVHAEVAGAASVIIKNSSAAPVPPRTLQEAGQAAVAYSVAWDAKVLTRAWWVHASQVSKSAPTGEYLTTGSFMIRGRKNYLLPDHLQFGFSFMFRLEDSCIDRHRDERKAIALEDASDVTSVQDHGEDQEIPVSDDDEPTDNEGEDAANNQPADNVSAENEPACNNRPVEKEPADNRSFANEPADNRPVENEPADNRPVVNEPADNRPVENEPADNQPVENEPAENRAVANEIAHNLPVANEPPDNRPVENEPLNGPAENWAFDPRLIMPKILNPWDEMEPGMERFYDLYKQFRTPGLNQELPPPPPDYDPKFLDDLLSEEKNAPGTKMKHFDVKCGLPDTHIRIHHGNGLVIIARTYSNTRPKHEEPPESPEFPELPRRDKNPKKKKEEKKKVDNGLKRGQRGKLKKIKEKYKDQDEEDRAIMMEILQSAKSEKESKKAQKKAAAAKANKSKHGPRGQKIPQPPPVILEVDSETEEPKDPQEPKHNENQDEDLDNEPEPEAEHQGPDADTEMLCQLTGIPHPEDELLFAVPVVAPYSALVNYKFKVKLTPGGSKRGKAAKTAVQVFLKDKTATPREKNLLKAVKEENIARNFPGKVKLSAPQLHKHKK